jgi:hypothetical protein
MNPSDQIDQLIDGIADWRGKMLAEVRKTFLSADKAMVEDWKWKGSPVWSCDGMIAVANAHKEKVKITFSHGAKLEDPAKLFNNGLGGSAWRAIDLHEGDKLDKAALKNLIRAAIAYNQSKLKKNAPAKAKVTKAASKKATSTTRAKADKTATAKSPKTARAKASKTA